MTRLTKRDFDAVLDAEIEELERRKEKQNYPGIITDIAVKKRNEFSYKIFNVRLRRNCSLKYLDPLAAQKYRMSVNFFYTGGEREIELVTESARAGLFSVGEQVTLRVPEDTTLGIQKKALETFCEGENEFLYTLGEALFMGKRPPTITPSHLKAKHALNPTQARAVETVLGMREKDYFLIQGPPGTGKTTTIREIVKAFPGKILITSHTNIAIDNVLEGLKDESAVRLGASLKTLDSVQDLLPQVGEGESIREKTLGGLKAARVVGATLSKMGVLYSMKCIDWQEPPFDLVIIDEASMSSFPLTLLGLHTARRFLLVGDHMQLSPIFISRQDESVLGQKINPDVRKSLFELLIAKKWNSTMLDVQYRSNKRIMGFVSNEFYQGKLKTDVSVADLQLPEAKIDKYLPITDPAKPVVWLDTASRSKGRWRRYGQAHSYFNQHEAGVCAKLVAHFIETGLSPVDVSVIAPYRIQTEVIKNALANLHQGADVAPIEMMSARTVHAFQGRQNKIVIYNIVLDDVVFQTKDRFKIFRDGKLVNVALSRPEAKLIIVGSSKVAHEQELPLIAHLFKYVQGLDAVVSDDLLSGEMPHVDALVESAYRALGTRR